MGLLGMAVRVGWVSGGAVQRDGVHPVVLLFPVVIEERHLDRHFASGLFLLLGSRQDAKYLLLRVPLVSDHSLHVVGGVELQHKRIVPTRGLVWRRADVDRRQVFLSDEFLLKIGSRMYPGRSCRAARSVSEKSTCFRVVEVTVDCSAGGTDYVFLESARRYGRFGLIGSHVR